MPPHGVVCVLIDALSLLPSPSSAAAAGTQTSMPRVHDSDVEPTRKPVAARAPSWPAIALSRKDLPVRYSPAHATTQSGDVTELSSAAPAGWMRHSPSTHWMRGAHRPPLGGGNDLASHGGGGGGGGSSLCGGGGGSLGDEAAESLGGDGARALSLPSVPLSGAAEGPAGGGGGGGGGGISGGASGAGTVSGGASSVAAAASAGRGFSSLGCWRALISRTLASAPCLSPAARRATASALRVVILSRSSWSISSLSRGLVATQQKK